MSHSSWAIKNAGKVGKRNLDLSGLTAADFKALNEGRDVATTDTMVVLITYLMLSISAFPTCGQP